MSSDLTLEEYLELKKRLEDLAGDIKSFAAELRAELEGDPLHELMLGQPHGPRSADDQVAGGPPPAEDPVLGGIDLEAAAAAETELEDATGSTSTTTPDPEDLGNEPDSNREPGDSPSPSSGV